MSPLATVPVHERVNPALAVLQVDRLFAAATSLQEQAAAYAAMHPDRLRMLHCANVARQEARSLAAALGFTGA